MSDFKDTVERALELAESGEYTSVNHVRQQLRREGHTDVHTQLSGPHINRQIVDIIRKTSLDRSLRRAVPN